MKKIMEHSKSRVKTEKEEDHFVTKDRLFIREWHTYGK